MKSSKFWNYSGSRVLLTAVFLLSLTFGFVSPAAAATASRHAIGAVYTITNDPAGNVVLVYDRFADGSIVYQGSYATGGLGSGASLASQSGVILDQDNHFLYAVNAGSNQISAFKVRQRGLDLVAVVDSGGMMPTSLTVFEKVYYQSCGATT